MSLGEEDYHLVGPFATCINKNRIDRILNRPSKRKRRSSSRESSRQRRPRHRKCGRERTNEGKKGGQLSQKVIKGTRSKKGVICPEKNEDVHHKSNKNKSPLKSGSSPSNRMRRHARNRNRGSSRKCKSTKRRKCSLDREYEDRFSGQNIEFNEDCQSGIGTSSSSYVTCCDGLNPENANHAKQVYEKGVHFNGMDGPSRLMTENIAPSSEETSSQDSIFQELKGLNSKSSASNCKDLKKWIKNCRRGCRR